MRNNAELEHERLQPLLHPLLLETEIEMKEVFGQYTLAVLSQREPVGENIELLLLLHGEEVLVIPRPMLFQFVVPKHLVDHSSTQLSELKLLLNISQAPKGV